MSTSRPAPSCPPTATASWSRRNATAATDYGNGPEWMFSNGDSRFVYTQCQAPCDPPNGATASLGLATQVGGTWTTTTLPNSVARASPAATLDLGDPDPRINYVNTDKTAWYMRKTSALGVEIELPLSSLSNGNARRWVPGTRKIVFPGHDPNDPQLLREQVYLYDTDSGELPEQLTFHPNGVEGAMMWRAPEFNNEYAFFTMAKGRQQILVYRQAPRRRPGAALDHRQDDQRARRPALLLLARGLHPQRPLVHLRRGELGARRSSTARCRTSSRSAASIRCARTRGC